MQVRLFSDDNKHVRQLAKNAVAECGDRLLRIVDNTTKELFKEYHICSVVLKEVPLTLNPGSWILLLLLHACTHLLYFYLPLTSLAIGILPANA